MEPIPSLLLKDSKKGFSLVEMLVVLSIITIITSIVLLGQGQFNRAISLTDTAYTIALSVRQAQALGLSSRTFNGVYDAGYGVRFTAGNQSYQVFVDIARVAPQLANCPVVSDASPEAKPGNCFYDVGADGVFDQYAMQRGFRISRFCGVNASGNTICSDTGALDTLDIVYVRPSTDSIITGTDGGTQFTLSRAMIYVTTPDGQAERGVCVSVVGQVSVVQGTCS